MLYIVLTYLAAIFDRRLHPHYVAAAFIGREFGRVAMRDYWRSGVYLNVAHQLHLRIERALVRETRRRCREWGRPEWTMPLIGPSARSPEWRWPS
jgi:hypothetical protein